MLGTMIKLLKLTPENCCVTDVLLRGTGRLLAKSRTTLLNESPVRRKSVIRQQSIASELIVMLAQIFVFMLRDDESLH